MGVGVGGTSTWASLEAGGGGVAMLATLSVGATVGFMVLRMAIVMSTTPAPVIAQPSTTGSTQRRDGGSPGIDPPPTVCTTPGMLT
jgi:hypothetical protein